jgi:hypothetical protein
MAPSRLRESQAGFHDDAFDHGPPGAVRLAEIVGHPHSEQRQAQGEQDKPCLVSASSGEPNKALESGTADGDAAEASRTGEVVSLRQQRNNRGSFFPTDTGAEACGLLAVLERHVAGPVGFPPASRWFEVEVANFSSFILLRNSKPEDFLPHPDHLCASNHHVAPRQLSEHRVKHPSPSQNPEPQPDRTEVFSSLMK